MDYREHGAELQRFADWQPTQFDARGLGSDGQEDWRVLPVVQTRDSDALARSNFRSAERMLEEAGVSYENHRFGHWGPGWIEILVIEPTDAGLTLAGKIVCALESYPVLDDDDHGALESEEAYAAWLDWGYREFIRALAGTYLTYSTGDWLEDADELERNWCLLWRNSRAFGYFGHADGWDAFIASDHGNLSRDCIARLLWDLRTIRRTGDLPKPPRSVWREDDREGR